MVQHQDIQTEIMFFKYRSGVLQLIVDVLNLFLKQTWPTAKVLTTFKIDEKLKL